MHTNEPTGASCGAQDCDGKWGLSRRNFLRTGVFSFLGLGMLDLLRVQALAGGDLAKCDAVILIWLAGGPSHIDTFDPKPGQETAGPFNPIKTSVDGVMLSEHLPTIAKNLKYASLIRSMTNKEGSHERATYQMHTGYMPLASIKHPSVGSLVVKERGTRNEGIPSYISIGRSAFGAGFLGTDVAPFYIQDVNNPTRNLLPHGTPYQQREFDPNSPQAKRFQRRIDMLQLVDQEFSRQKRDERMLTDYGNYYRDAVRMMVSKSTTAFDLTKEKEMYLKGYGENGFGRACLMARRLIEEGVRFVEVSLGGWDTHDNNFERVQSLSQTLDPAVGTLIEDLQARGLLKRTLVICTGEFGRTPKINNRAGRDHYPRVWSSLVAGGGIKEGFVYGSSDAQGTAVKDSPVNPGQLHATMFKLLGVDFKKDNYTPEGRPIKVVDKGDPVDGLIA